MSNLSDKDIDGLSRDAAEFYEPDSSMLSWQRLEQHLIEQIPERPPDIRSFFRTRPFIWAPAVLILTGITYFFIKNTAHNKISTLNAPTEISHPNRPVASAPATNYPSPENAGNKRSDSESSTNAGTGNSAAGNAPTGNSANSASGNSAAGNAATGNSTAGEITDRNDVVGNTAPGSAITNNNGRGNLNLNQRDKHKRTLTSGDVNGAASGKSRAKASGSEQKDAAGEVVDEGETATSPLIGHTATNSGQQDDRRQKDDLSWLGPAAFNSRPVVSGNDSSLNRFAASQKQAGKPSKSLRINRSLSIGLVMGPDYSNVDGTASDQLGNNLGISVGYYLSSRLSVNTGIQYTIKDYWSGGKAFQPQPANNTSPAYTFPRIESVNGSLKMLEIPLNLRYDFLRSERSRLFVTAGLSSYLLQRESYTLFFHNAGRAYEWPNEDNTHQNYWMGVGSFSAGLEQDLGKGFSFQVEPFLRLPFRGIGAGDIKLKSYGMLFSIRYSPILGKTRK